MQHRFNQLLILFRKSKSDKKNRTLAVTKIIGLVNLLLLSHKENVLEIGCAGGSITRNILLPYIKDYLKTLVAVDKSENMIKYAKETNDSEHIDFQVMNATNKEEIAKRKDEFDHIFSLFVAHWIPDNRNFISGLYAMLKPKGQIFVTVIAETAVHKAFAKQAIEGKWSKYIPNEPVLVDYTKSPTKYFANLVRDVGFNVEFCEAEKEHIIIKQFPDVIRVILHFNRFTDRIPLHLQEAYFQDHLRLCYEQGGYLGGSDDYDLPVTSMLCVASK
ncbi:putative juvenile hormone acid methyltransferase [Trypoxylus dichotomus]